MQSFEEVVGTPEAWFRKSWQMYEASIVNFQAFRDLRSVTTERELHRQNGLMQTSKLCLALSLENAFKGAFVYLSKPDLSRNKLDPKHFHKKAHDLVDLAIRLGFTLTPEETQLLARFSSFIIWAARYSAPLTENAYVQFDGENKITFPTDFDFVEKLIIKLQNKSGYSDINGWPLES